MKTEVLGLIPARSGSKGIQNKNLNSLAGRTLMEYTVSCVKKADCVDRLVLSTDSGKIADLGRSLGVEVPFIRPQSLAGDKTPMIDVVKHALDELKQTDYVPELILLLQLTAPLRQPWHLSRAVEMILQEGCDSVVSAVELPLCHSPDYVMRLNQEGCLLPFLDSPAKPVRRQDARPAFYRDGTVYAFRRKTLDIYGDIYGKKCKPLLLRPEETLPLDTPREWEAAETRLKEGERKYVFR